MNAAQRLHDEYQRKLKQLQETCPHKEQTDWLEEWWAPGHSTDRMVKTCKNCNKVLQAKRCCQGCLKEFLESELQEGDGRTLPFGAWYCGDCYSRELSKRLGPSKKTQGQGGQAAS
jgi:hypothetical protein